MKDTKLILTEDGFKEVEVVSKPSKVGIRGISIGDCFGQIIEDDDGWGEKEDFWSDLRGNEEKISFGY